MKKVTREKVENLLVGEMEPGWEGLRADTAGRREPEHRIYIKIFVSLG